jgi:uncharacterized membrane protein
MKDPANKIHPIGSGKCRWFSTPPTKETDKIFELINKESHWTRIQEKITNFSRKTAINTLNKFKTYTFNLIKQVIIWTIILITTIIIFFILFSTSFGAPILQKLIKFMDLGSSTAAESTGVIAGIFVIGIFVIYSIFEFTSRLIKKTSQDIKENSKFFFK